MDKNGLYSPVAKVRFLDPDTVVGEVRVAESGKAIGGENAQVFHWCEQPVVVRRTSIRGLRIGLCSR